MNINQDDVPPSILLTIAIILIGLIIAVIVFFSHQEPEAHIKNVISTENSVVSFIKGLKEHRRIKITLGDSNYTNTQKELAETDKRQVYERELMRTLPISEIEQTMHNMCTEMYGEDQWMPLYNLVMSESGFNPIAQNPNSTAYGLFQFLDSTWEGTGIAKTDDPLEQIMAGFIYIKNRYNDPTNAWEHKQINNWY